MAPFYTYLEKNYVLNVVGLGRRRAPKKSAGGPADYKNIISNKQYYGVSYRQRVL